VLSHYLSFYVVLMFLCYLLFVKKGRLFSVKNLLAVAIPVVIIGVYLYFAFLGLKYMSAQNQAIAHKVAAQPFTILHVITSSMALGAVDFREVLSAFGEKTAAIVLGFLVVVALYVFAIVKTTDKVEKRNLHLLFILGASGSIFLAALCLKSHHYTALYSRYHSFCTPYACLFMAYLMYVLSKNTGVNKLVIGGVMVITLLPSCVLFAMSVKKNNAIVKYSHTAIAKEIEADKVTKIEVPEWDDALLIQSLLPDDCKVDYALNKSSANFILYKANAIEHVTIIKTTN